MSGHRKTLEPLPFNILGVEQEILIDIGGKPFNGYIDVIGELDSYRRRLYPYGGA